MRWTTLKCFCAWLICLLETTCRRQLHDIFHTFLFEHVFLYFGVISHFVVILCIYLRCTIRKRLLQDLLQDCSSGFFAQCCQGSLYPPFWMEHRCYVNARPRIIFIGKSKRFLSSFFFSWARILLLKTAACNVVRPMFH